MNYNEIFTELAKYTRMKEELEEIIENLKDTVKQYMTENNIDTLTGDEHKAIYKQVTSNRLDSAALKKELPDIAKRYTKPVTSARFTFS